MSSNPMQQMMAQAEALQRKLAAAQEEVAATEVTGSAGGGMVTVVVAGGGAEVKTVTIQPDAVDPDDVEMLQDMVVAALNDALRSAKELEAEKLGGVAGGLNLPPGLV
ncbi:MAG: YbaB/EbfC family nucleoid-associated protein [Egibacteraceae bacterium]